MAIYANPDFAIGLAQFCVDLEILPVLLLLGDDNVGCALNPSVFELKEHVWFDMKIITNADLWVLEYRLKNKCPELDLILGHSKRRFVSVYYGVPVVKVEFPVYDRSGAYRYPVVGYGGVAALVESMTNMLFTDIEYKKRKKWVLNV